jgi:hypothetical protein
VHQKDGNPKIWVLQSQHLVPAGCSRFNQENNLDQTQELGQMGQMGQIGTKWDKLGQKQKNTTGVLVERQKTSIVTVNYL